MVKYQPKVASRHGLVSSGQKNDRVQEKFQKFEKNRKNSKLKKYEKRLCRTLVGSCVPNLGSLSQLEVTKKSGELNLVRRRIRIRIRGYISGSKLVIFEVS